MAFHPGHKNRTVVASDVKMVLRDVTWRSGLPLRRTLPYLYRESPNAIMFAKKTPQQPNVFTTVCLQYGLTIQASTHETSRELRAVQYSHS